MEERVQYPCPDEPVMKTARCQLQSFITRDGSEIIELFHPGSNGNAMQSLAEARVACGCATRLHRHHQSEELYHILSGTGRMTLGREVLNVRRGDTVCILPGVAHCLENTGKDELVFLCCCAPPYTHQDTELL